MDTYPEMKKAVFPLPSPNYQSLLELINGYRISQMIHVAAKLGIADSLSDGPLHFAELAKACGAHVPSLIRLLRALASVGVFAEDDQGRFSLTPLAEPLRKGVPDSAHDWAVFIGDAQHWRSWEQLEFSVSTGETAFPHVWGMQNWEYRAQNPEANQIFNEAMTSTIFERIGPVMDAYDFSGINTIVDVGGGHGAFIAAILKSYPSMGGVLFDLPHVVAGAAPVLEDASVARRCQIVGGNFMESLPAGGDAYLLSRVVHDWDDEEAVTILKGCRQVMNSEARLLLVEAVIPPGNAPHPGKISDINMMVNLSGGRERTETEFRTLFGAAGFRLSRIVATVGEVSVVEGMPF